MKSILVVDDDNMSLRMAKHVLSAEYEIATVESGTEALAYLANHTPNLILMDINMPDMDGKEAATLIRSNLSHAKIPIIFLTADTNPETETACIQAGADDFITRTFVPTVMLVRIKRILELDELKTNLEGLLENKTKQLETVTLNSIMSIANTIDAKDKYTSGHSIRVAKCSVAIAKELGWSDERIRNFHYVALLHDIGKIGIPDAILNKPTSLTDEEFEIIKKHPIIGGEILKDIHMIEHVQEGALFHHEKFDGSGYPAGIKGNDIPLYARIVCIADSYDAMSSNRVYRPKLTTEEIISEFRRCRGTQFDPQLIDLFISMLEKGYSVSEDDDDNEFNLLLDESSRLLSTVIEKYTSEANMVSMTDNLTGLYNRNYIDREAEQFYASCESGAFMIIDLDNFKYVNDKYGHIMGDKTLQIFANAFTASCTEDDIPCRLGGDEFAIMSKNVSSKEELIAKAENIIANIISNIKDLEYSDVVSASIGIAMYPYDGNDFMELYRNADKALYYVKNNGKNSYHFYGNDNPDKVYGVTADLQYVRQMIEGRMDISQGSFCVAYQEFKKLYNFISRYVERNPNTAQIVLLTLNENNKSTPSNISVIDCAMEILEKIVRSTLRSVDVGTKYSSSQYVLILVNTNAENGRTVAERLLDKFYHEYGKEDVTLTFDLQTIEPKKESI